MKKFQREEIGRGIVDPAKLTLSYRPLTGNTSLLPYVWIMLALSIACSPIIYLSVESGSTDLYKCISVWDVFIVTVCVVFLYAGLIKGGMKLMFHSMWMLIWIACLIGLITVDAILIGLGVLLFLFVVSSRLRMRGIWGFADKLLGITAGSAMGFAAVSFAGYYFPDIGNSIWCTGAKEIISMVVSVVEEIGCANVL